MYSRAEDALNGRAAVFYISIKRLAPFIIGSAFGGSNHEVEHCYLAAPASLWLAYLIRTPRTENSLLLSSGSELPRTLHISDSGRGMSSGWTQKAGIKTTNSSRLRRFRRGLDALEGEGLGLGKSTADVAPRPSLGHRIDVSSLWMTPPLGSLREAIPRSKLRSRICLSCRS